MSEDDAKKAGYREAKTETTSLKHSSKAPANEDNNVDR